jgi:hypothetical protein
MHYMGPLQWVGADEPYFHRWLQHERRNVLRLRWRAGDSGGLSEDSAEGRHSGAGNRSTRVARPRGILDVRDDNALTPSQIATGLASPDRTRATRRGRGTSKACRFAKRRRNHYAPVPVEEFRPRLEIVAEVNDSETFWIS